MAVSEPSRPRVISRLAPTPSGYLHWGNLFNFAETWSWVRRREGHLWLRIDDVDVSRYRPEYVQDLFDTLEWMGLDWDRGPRNLAQFETQYSQTLRFPEYREKLSQIATYVCDCSRRQVLERGNPDPISGYDGYCKGRNLQEIPGITALRAKVNDVVLWTRENRPSYHWVSVGEDVRMGTTALIRGEDLRPISKIQMQLAQEAGFDVYLSIEHRFHPLLLDAQGLKLSKSTANRQPSGADSLRDWRLNGRTPAEAWRHLAQLSRRPKIVENPWEWMALPELDSI